MNTPDGRLTTWSRELLLWWTYYNRVHAGEAMRPPTIAVDDSTRRLGAWTARTRTLAISAAHIEAAPWLEVMETLRHEMAHQYADEVLGATDETAHGPAFRRACELLRADPRATGRPEGDPARPTANGDDPTARVIARVHKLLALGESPNENEAQAAINKAHELLLRHNIETLGDADGRSYTVRRVGPLRGRHHLYEQLLASVLGEFFFVDVLWAHSYDALRDKRGTVLEVCGTPANLDMAEYVHEFLAGVASSLWDDYRARAGLRGNRDRLRYIAGVIEGFVQKLRAQQQRLRREHALVWRGDAELDAFVRRRHPHLRTSYTGGHSAASRAFADGVEAGRNVTLRRPLSERSGGIAGILEG